MSSNPAVFSIPLVHGYSRSETGLVAYVDDEFIPFIYTISQWWFIHSRREPNGQPKITVIGSDVDTGKPAQTTIFLNRVCYLCSQLSSEERERLCKKEFFLEFFEKLRNLPRISHLNKNRLDCRINNLSTSVNPKDRQLRMKKLGYDTDLPPLETTSPLEDDVDQLSDYFKQKILEQAKEKGLTEIAGKPVDEITKPAEKPMSIVERLKAINLPDDMKPSENNQGGQ